MKESQEIKLKLEMAKAAARFYKGMIQLKQPSPSLFRLMLFRITRTSLKHYKEMELRDYYYFKEKGWFESDYYYDTSFGLVKKAAGNFFDFLGRRIVKYM